MSGTSESLIVETVPTQEPLALILSMLRDEVTRDPSDHTVELAYHIANRISLGVAYQSDASRSAFDILDNTRNQSRPRTVRLTAETDEDSPAGTHSEYRRILTVNHSTILKPDVFRKNLFKAKVEVRHEGDVELISFLKVAAHEAGHATLGGVSRLMRASIFQSNIRNLEATRDYLSNHPEMGFTGNWETDVWIHEERFAEGFANLVTSEALKALGYSPGETRKFIKCSRLATDVQGSPGSNQIDHLVGVTADITLAEKVVDGKRRQKYPGEFGYEKPLSKKQILAQLKELNTLCQQDGTQQVVDPEAWLTSVQARQLYRYRHHIKNLQKKRHDVLNPEVAARRNTRRSKLIGGAAISIILATGAGAQADFELISTYSSRHGAERVLKDTDFANVDIDKDKIGTTITAELSEQSSSQDAIDEELKKLVKAGANTGIVYRWDDTGVMVAVTNKLSKTDLLAMTDGQTNSPLNFTAEKNGSIARQAVDQLIRDTNLWGTTPHIDVIRAKKDMTGRLTAVYHFHDFAQSVLAS